MGLKIGNFTGSKRFQNLVKASKNVLQKMFGKERMDLWDAMHSSSVATSRSVSTAAIKYYKNYARNRVNQLKGGLMKPGHMYMFNYDTPATEDILEYFDTQPLVVVIGIKKTKAGLFREVGINLHHLPPRVRRLAIYRIHGLFESYYRKGYGEKELRSKYLDYQIIKRSLKDLGVGFAVRMYIPRLRKNTIEFPPKVWENSIWIPSKGYKKITAVALEKKWREYVKENKLKNLVGESHKTAI